MSIVSLDMVFKTFCNPSKSNGSLGYFFFGSSLKETFLDLCYSMGFLFSRAMMHFSTAIASFILSAKVVLLALSMKIAMFDGKVEMYHSLCTSSLGLEAVEILFNGLLKRELKSLICSFNSALRLDRSLINVAVDLSSPNLVKNCSWKISQLVIDPDGNEKYHDSAAPCKV